MGLTNIIYMLVFGLIIGLLARLIMPGRDSMGWLSTSLLGIAGSFLGTLAKSMLLPRSPGAAGWILSLIGALIVLAAYNWFAGQRSRA